MTFSMLTTLMRSRSAAVGGLLLAVTLLAAGCGRNDTSPPPNGAAETTDASREPEQATAGADIVTVDAAAQEQIQLRVEPAATRSLAATIRTTGVIGPDETRLAHIRPLARGVVERVLVRRGDRVRAGQVLLHYDNVELGDLLADYRTASAGVEQAIAEGEVTARALERGGELVELGAISRADYERRRAEDARARAALNAERARLASVEQKLRRFGVDEVALARAGEGDPPSPRTELRAPFAGVVIQMQVADGEVVDPERALLTVANLSTVWVQGDVYERDLGAVGEGQLARVFVSAYPDEAFTGRITYVSDILEPATRAAKVRCEVSNADGRLKLEMAATLEIPASRGRQALAVPAAAVQRIAGETVVFVQAGDDRFAKRAVEIGAESDGWIEIADGLTAGEPVVTQGALMLKSKLTLSEFAEEEEARE